MMKKEDAAYTKFTQIGTEKEEKDKRASRRKVAETKTEDVAMSSLEESYHYYVQGILLLLLEDDSAAVRLAGINTMAFFA